MTAYLDRARKQPVAKTHDRDNKRQLLERAGVPKNQIMRPSIHKRNSPMAVGPLANWSHVKVSPQRTVCSRPVIRLRCMTSIGLLEARLDWLCAWQQHFRLVPCFARSIPSRSLASDLSSLPNRQKSAWRYNSPDAASRATRFHGRKEFRRQVHYTN